VKEAYVVFLRRFVRALSMGFVFSGTTRFQVPPSFRFRNKVFKLQVPSEESLSWVFRDLVLDDEYGLLELSSQPTTIIDVGANVGFFSVWAGACFPEATIHSYEPSMAIQEILRTNVDQVGATVYAEGVAETDGRGVFHQANASRMSQCQLSSEGSVPITSLQSALKRIGGHVDLLKLDCEGAEWSILQDVEALRNVRQVRMEYHLMDGRFTVEDLVETFQKAEFETLRIERNVGFGIAWFANTK
jgi:FkbM family methyltransferase